MRTVQAEWADFEKTVIPADAPTIQRVEMRRAFYAGATALLQIMLELGDYDVSEDGGMMVIEGLRQECREFFEAEVAATEQGGPL